MDDPAAYQAEGILYLTPLARFDHLLRLPGGADAGKAVNEAMRDIEANNPQLASVLPRTYQIFDSTLLKNLLKKLSEIPATAEGDTFGRIYEYFLGQFARTRGQKNPFIKNGTGRGWAHGFVRSHMAKSASHHSSCFSLFSLMRCVGTWPGPSGRKT